LRRGEDASYHTDRTDSAPQVLLAEEQAMITKLRDRYIELDIEHFPAELEAMDG